MRPIVRFPPRRLLLAPFVLALAAFRAGAQDVRTVESSRQVRDTLPLDVHVRYGGGRLQLRPTAERVLYEAELRYDPEWGRPVLAYDSIARRLDIGLRTEGSGRLRRGRDARLRLGLSPRVPMDLTVDIGAVDGEIDLGGLALQSVVLNAGATDATVRFDSATTRPMRRLEIHAGVGELRVERLANANTGIVDLNSGVGSVTLDFGGAWTRDVDLDASTGMGGLTLRVPRDVGVRVELSRFLASFQHEGLRKRGDAWISDNWDDARHRLRVRSSTAFGQLRIERY